jgi:hypothetical protein
MSLSQNRTCAQRRLVPGRLGRAQLVILHRGLKECLCRATKPLACHSEVAGSSPVAPAKDFKDLAWSADPPSHSGSMLPYRCAHTTAAIAPGPSPTP